MNIMATSEANIVSLLNNVKNIHGIIYEARQNEVEYKNKPCELIDKLNDIDDGFKRIESIIMHCILEMKCFKQYCDTNMASLMTLRNTMLNEIDKRRNTEVQMNILGEVYDEENLVTNFSIILNGDEVNGVHKIKMDQITDPKEYSIVNMVNRFESEETLLEDIKTATQFETSSLLERLELVKSKVKDVRNRCSDTEFVNMLCGDKDEVIDELRAFYNDMCECSASINTFEGRATQLFQIYQELIHNYKVYANVVDIYISFALECFFNDYSKYEF